MAKDQMTPERYAVDAMNMAIGTLLAFRSGDNGVNDTIERLRVAVDRFDPRCDHDWEGALAPGGMGVQGWCKKCKITRISQ